MPNINEQILDLLLKRDLLLQRVSNNLNKQIANEYIKIINNAIEAFNKQEISIINMNKIIKEISQRFEFDYDTIAYEQFKELGIAEASYIPNGINTLVDVDIVNKVLPEPLIEKVIKASFLDKGLLLKDAFSSFDDNLKNVMINEIRNGVLVGATNAEMVKNMKPFFNSMLANNLDALVKTSVSTVVNDVRIQTYKENESIFSGYQHHSVLDFRTTFICAERDGKKWTLEYKPIDHKLPFKNVPIHFRCRSVLLPITKTYKELGLDIGEIPEGTRASMNGQVPESTTFAKWFEGQSKANQEKYLGVERYNLYKEGKINFSDLVNQRGQTVAIKDLNKLSDVVEEVKDNRTLFSSAKISKNRDDDTYMALDTWTGGEDYHIKQAFRENIINDDERLNEIFSKSQIKEIKDFNNIFETYQPDRFESAYRGLHFDVGDDTINKFTSLKVGDIIEDKAPSSWSKNQSIAREFAGGDEEGYNGVLYKLKNAKGYDIEKYSEYSEEEEILMLPKKIRITKVIQEGSKTIFETEEIE